MAPTVRVDHQPIGRRRFLASAGTTAGVLLGLAACGGSSADRAASSSTTSRPTPPRRLALHPAGADLALPEGFAYSVLSSTADGIMPPAPDGMAMFAMPDGTTRLVRNHERADRPGAATPLDPATAYDASASGGTTTLVLAPDLRTVVSQHVSLSGTLQNCAGGATPRGTWLSCEESNEGPEQGWGMAHGYVFEVAAGADAPVATPPLTAMGRFLHEAVAVDPSGVIYLTEDNGYDSGLYRFTPTAPGDLAQGGALEMLAVEGQPEYDTAFGQRIGAPLAVSWVPIGDPDPATAGTDSSAVFNQGLALGGARFKRVEGCCLVGPALYVAVTEGGDAGLGQIWAYDTAAAELRLIVEAADPDELFGPDNVVAAPFADHVIISEDNGNGDVNRLHALAGDGTLVTFAENIADTTEFAGPCFSADGSTLFVNIYGDATANVPGRTLAIWGPWESLA